jgi:hypothetical protein
LSTDVVGADDVVLAREIVQIEEGSVVVGSVGSERKNESACRKEKAEKGKDVLFSRFPLLIPPAFLDFLHHRLRQSFAAPDSKDSTSVGSAKIGTESSEGNFEICRS